MTEGMLRQLYLTERLTEAQIAAQTGLTQRQVNRLRSEYGIATITKSERRALPCLTPQQRSLLLGSILGDARLLRTGRATAALSEYHSEKQYPYLQWKAAMWGEHVCSTRFVTTHRNGRDYRGQVLRTYGSSNLFPYWQQTYPTGKGDKVFDQMDLAPFDALSLAVWFLDDGSKVDNGYVRFAVTPNEESQKTLLGLLRRFGLTPVLSVDTSGDASINIHDRTSMSRFIDLVSPHIPASMSYKLSLCPRARGMAPRDVLTRDLLTEHSGKSVHWIAQATGTSVASVQRALDRQGLAVEPRATLSWEEVSERVRSGITDDDLVDLIVALPMPSGPSPEAARRDFDCLRQRTLARIEGGVISGGGRVGLALCDSFFPYRYEASREGRPSVREAWFNPQYVRKAIDFQRKVGDPLYPKNVFRALRALLTAPSNFRPAVAKRLVEDFSPVGGVVLDPCAGYGGRAAGTLAAGRRYIGVDPHPKAAKAYADLDKFLGGGLTFHHAPFEEADVCVEADLVFTSPPYFSVERYSNDATQSWVRYPTWDLWVDRFLRVMCAKSFNSLKPGGVMLLNVADAVLAGGGRIPLVQACIDAAVRCGFEHRTTLGMALGTFGRRRREEPVLVFTKHGGACTIPSYVLPAGQVIRDVYATGVPGLDADTLHRLYAVELRTDADIASQLGVSDVLVSQQRKRHGIRTLTAKEREDQKSVNQRPLSSLTPDMLRHLYLSMSDQEVATLYGTSKVTIRNRRRMWGIEAITKSERAASGKYR
jgi:hypothetical protein